MSWNRELRASPLTMGRSVHPSFAKRSSGDVGKLTVLANDQVNRLDFGLASSDTSLIDICCVEFVLLVALHQAPDGLDGIKVLQDTIEVAGVSDVFKPNWVRDRASLKIVRVVEERARFTMTRYRPERICYDPRLCSFCLEGVLASLQR